jgi:hypothetical protein
MYLSAVSDIQKILNRGRTKKQRLSRMVQHYRPNTPKKRVSSRRNKGKQNEEEHVKSEYDNRYPVNRSAIIREIMQKDRNNTGSHSGAELRTKVRF